MIDCYEPMADSNMPQSMTAMLPNMVDTARVAAAAGGTQGTGVDGGIATNAPGITPQYLLDRLPSIVAPAPVVKPPACDDFTQWVNDNSLIVAGALGVLVLMVWWNKI